MSLFPSLKRGPMGRPTSLRPCTTLSSRETSSKLTKSRRQAKRSPAPPTMNLFRLVGDMAHLASFLVLLLKLLASRSANGISLKTQELFFLVFVTRYVDLFFHFVSVYNTIMKLLFLLFSGAIVYVIRFKEPFRSTYDKSHDAFLHLKFAVLPCALLALVFNEQFEVFEILWTFSIYLEAVAIIPQLILLQRHGEVENLTSNYVVLLGAYRGCYVLNWIYRAATETSYHFIWLMFIAGMVQTALYVDFFYYYAISKYHGKKMTLPS